MRTGFRELRIRDGWFELNGRRIYLRSTHTGNHYPIGQVVPQDPALVRQDLVYAKAAGFNTVRFIAGVAREDQLDLLRRARPDGLRGDTGGLAARRFAPDG